MDRMFKKPMIAIGCIACGMILIGAGLGYTVNQAAHFTQAPDIESPEQQGNAETLHFFFPALSLLSGTVLAAMGAIALAHRWRGIS